MNNKHLNESAAKIAELTAGNNHTGALVEVAKYIGKRDNLNTMPMIKALKAVSDLHSYFGDMPPHLDELRAKIQDTLFKQLNPLESLRIKAARCNFNQHKE